MTDTQTDRMLVEAIISDYHTTRMAGDDYVSHILGMGRTIEAFARHRTEAITTLERQLAETRRSNAELDRLLHRIRRTSEGSAGIMRDNRRTGRWEGAEKTARQFDRLAKYAEAAEAEIRALKGTGK